MAQERDVLSIFVLDDVGSDQAIIKRFLTGIVFKNQKVEINQCFSLKDAEKQLLELKNSIDLFILDGSLSPGFGYDLIPTIKVTNLGAKIVMCSGLHASNRIGVEKGADMAILKNDIGFGKDEEIKLQLLHLLNS